jgi:hypothetical protein
LAIIFTYASLATSAPLVSGGVVLDAISSPGEQDTHTFTANVGESVQLEVAATGADPTTRPTPWISVYDPSGTLLVSTAANPIGVFLCVPTFSNVCSNRLTASGTYTVVIQDGSHSANRTGPYEIHFIRAPGATEGGPLSSGGVTSGTLDFGDLDSYTFTACEGESVQLQVATTGANPRPTPWISVYDPNGTLLVSTAANPIGVFLCPRCNDKLTASGTYTVVVQDGTQGPARTGPYSLAYTREGDGEVSSGHAACTNLCEIEAIAKEREGTVDELYAKFWLCLNEGACDEYANTGEEGIAGGFNKFMFKYMADHPESSTFKNFKCAEDAKLCFLASASGSLEDHQLCCVFAAERKHFRNELTPGFRAYCDEISPEQYDAWDVEHQLFVEKVNLPCFNQTFDIMIAPLGQLGILLTANDLRERTQRECLEAQAGRINRSMDFIAADYQLPMHPPPLTREELFSEELAAAGTLKVTAEGDVFFLPEGTQVQIKVNKNNPDGSVTDLTSSPETQYLIPEKEEFVSITPDGLLSILGSPSPFASERILLPIFIRNGDDRGIGQFAIIPKDEDGDLLADSYEMRFGLDPTIPNDVHSDVDGDGLSDRTELMMRTQPIVKDTDGDSFTDKVEFEAGTDPRDATRHPHGCSYVPKETDGLNLKSGVLSLAQKSRGDNLIFQGTFSAPAGSLDPATEGVAITLADADGQISCFRLPPGAGWKTSKVKWTFTDDKTGSLGTPNVKETMSIQYNARKNLFTLKANVQKTDLNDPDEGVISATVVIGDQGFINTQAWKLDKTGKQLSTP